MAGAAWVSESHFFFLEYTGATGRDIGYRGKRLDLEKLHTRHMASREGLGFI